jgi:tRNA pseudouridine38-40 synthase
MKRLKLTVAYDGTNYCGWQIQPNGITVEEVLNRALRKLTGEEITVIGASRTDSGVHALGNVAVFDSETSIPPERISYALNQRLPDDIVVIRSEEVPADWHPRYCNSKKTYEYHILNAKIPDPTRRLTRHFVSFDLDIEKMKKAAQYLVGTHDFVSFCNVRTDVEGKEVFKTKAGYVDVEDVNGKAFIKANTPVKFDPVRFGESDIEGSKTAKTYKLEVKE